MLACAKGHLDIVKYIIEQETKPCTNIDAINNVITFSPLPLVFSINKMMIIEQYGYNALMLACLNNQKNIAEYLINKIKDIYLKDNVSIYIYYLNKCTKFNDH